MKAACEVCGSPLRASPNRVEIDGAVMVVCNNCAKLGKQVGPAPFKPAPIIPARSAFRGARSIAPRPAPVAVAVEAEYDVDPDYNVIIRQAREKLGLSQEQLGKLLNEKPSVIKMVESKKLKPDATLTRKLMHELKINLLVSLSELEGGRPTGI
jgi:putative transcription factor